MTDIIDVSFACGGKANALVQAGVSTVIRYYSRDTGLPAKRLTKAEAKQFAAAGLKLAAVHEARHGDRIESFTEALGQADADYACQYAAEVIDQPAGSAIYFAVDLDVSKAQVAASVVPYFEGVAHGMAAAGRSYRVGVYGSGRTCAAVLDKGLASLAWLCQSTGFADYQAFLASNRWALRQLAVAAVAGVDCDPDAANPALGDFGAFSLGGAIGTGPMTSMQVIARSGLHLRSGPGLEYPSLGLLPLGTRLLAGKTTGDWTLVDRLGDGAVDGFVNSHYLAP
jgi:hypothetical protein